MNNNLIYALSLVIVINCVISVAKKSDEKVVHSNETLTDHAEHDNNLIENIFSEGNSVAIPTKSKIKARKGAIPDNSTEIIASNTPTNVTQDTSSKNNILTNVSVSNFTLNVTIPSSVNNITVPVLSLTTSTIKPQSPNSTTKPTTPSKTVTTTTKVITTTIKKPIKKPTVTYSADDNAQILESEKNINYNVSKIEDVIIPKTSSDTDRTIVDEESRTRRNYILYMGLAFALPMAFTLIHVTYKKVRNWMEIRHYQRVVS